MTDTEAKALALELRAAVTPRGKIGRPFVNIVIDAADYIEATEARHAAEMRELKERFSEVVSSWIDGRRYTPAATELFMQHFAPFILPTPDPLVEVFDECFHQNVEEGETWSQAMARKTRAALQARGYQVSKIGESGE